MTDDNHNKNPHGVYTDSFGGFDMIKAPALTYDAVIRALENGDFMPPRGRRFRNSIWRTASSTSNVPRRSIFPTPRVSGATRRGLGTTGIWKKRRLQSIRATFISASALWTTAAATQIQGRIFGYAITTGRAKTWAIMGRAWSALF